MFLAGAPGLKCFIAPLAGKKEMEAGVLMFFVISTKGLLL